MTLDDTLSEIEERWKTKPLELKEADVNAGDPSKQKDDLLRHAATLLRASRYALRKSSISAEEEHAGYFDSVHRLVAVIDNLRKESDRPGADSVSDVTESADASGASSPSSSLSPEMVTSS